MPRYLVERSFAHGGLQIPVTADGAAACLTVVDNNAEEGVTWVQSFVTPDHRRSYCIYDAPDPESIRRSAERNGLPVEHIVPVTILDPYFYH